MDTQDEDIAFPRLEHQELFVNDKMYKAFGATLFNSDGGDREDTWCKRWGRAVHFKCKQHNLPGGAVG